MNPKLRSTLEKIEALAKQNPEFALELQKIAKCSSPAKSASIPNGVVDDIAAIREALSIRADKSITYDFVSYQRTRDQLRIDNLRMENAGFEFKEKDVDCYKSFCVNAFYQVESIINYYFHNKYSDIKDIIQVVENATKNEKNDRYKYKRSEKEQYVSDIDITHKINAIYYILLPDEVNRDKVFMGKLKSIRNNFSHRGVAAESEEKSNETFNEFYNRYSLDYIRTSVIKLVCAIKAELETVKKPQWVEGVISSKLPSGCFVKYGDKNDQLPNKLYHKCKDLEQGNVVRLAILDGKIIAVTHNT